MKIKFVKNPLRWFEFKREAIILFANLQRNDKAHQHLDEYMKVVGILAYTLGMVVYIILYQLLCLIF